MVHPSREQDETKADERKPYSGWHDLNYTCVESVLRQQIGADCSGATQHRAGIASAIEVSPGISHGGFGYHDGPRAPDRRACELGSTAADLRGSEGAGEMGALRTRAHGRVAGERDALSR